MKKLELKKLIREEIRKVLRENNTPTHTITVYDPSQVDYIVDDLKAAGASVVTIESPDNDETFVDVVMNDQQLRKFQSEWGTGNAKDDWSVESL